MMLVTFLDQSVKITVSTCIYVHDTATDKEISNINLYYDDVHAK